MDALGKPLHIELSPGQRHEARYAEDVSSQLFGADCSNTVIPAKAGIQTVVQFHSVLDPRLRGGDDTSPDSPRTIEKIPEDLLAHAQGRYFFADTAYDGERIRRVIDQRGMTAVIRPHPSRTSPPPYDKQLYKERHIVEIFFNRIKHYRRLATRYEKTARNDLAIVHIACMMEWLL